MKDLTRLGSVTVIPMVLACASCVMSGGSNLQDDSRVTTARFEATHQPIETSAARTLTAASDTVGTESQDVCLRLAESRDESARHDAPVVVGTGTGYRADDPYEMRISPRLLVAGQENVEIRVSLARFGRDYRFAVDGEDAFCLRSHESGRELPITQVRRDGGELVGVVDEVAAEMAGWHEMVLVLNGRSSEPVPFAVRVVERIRIALTFDDGPSVEHFRYLGTNEGGELRTSTEKILDVLKAEGITGAFFVLTSPDTFLWRTHPKAETDEGFALLRRTVREGHVVAAHWGGTYGHQTVCHPARMAAPAYDHDGDGVVDRVSGAGNALETDLLQCIGRITEAYAAENRRDLSCEFVRPPLWRYRSGAADARPLYKRMGLKMIFTDSKLSDGGYPMAGGTFESWLVGGLRGSIAKSHADVILTMHDSNPHTARDIEGVLREIRASMTEQGFEEGTHWKFVDSAAEMTQLFRAKTHYRGLVTE